MKSTKYLAILFLLLFFIVPCQAAEVTLQWDPNSPTPSGYALFQRDHTIPGGYDYANPVWPIDGQDHTETSCTLTVPDAIETAYVVRAYVNVTRLDGMVEKQWSGDSNEVAVMPPGPQNPQGLIAQLITELAESIKTLARLSAALLDEEQ